MSTVSPHDDRGLDLDPDPDPEIEVEVESAVTVAGGRRIGSGLHRADTAPSEPTEALIGDTTDIEIDLTADPPRVVVKVTQASSPQVFAGAAVFRPVLVSLVVAAAIVVGYGVVVFGVVLFDGISPDTSPFDSARPDRTIVASRGSFTEPGRCSEVSGRVFVDGDGNAIADPWDPDHDYRGIEVIVETDAGVSRRLPVAPDGSWSLVLDTQAVASVAVEVPTIGETCRLDLGLVWTPAGVPSPWVGAIGDAVPAVATTGTDGTYAVSNLRPTASYTVTVAADDVITAARALGEPIETDDPAQIVIATSAAGMSVWGIDFGVGGSPVPVGSPGDDLGDTDRRDRDAS